MKLYFVFLFMMFFSCSDSKVLDTGDFTMKVPRNWTLVKEKGIDSFTGRIAIDKTDTISFDLGWYSDSLEEEEPYKIEDNSIYLINKEKSNSNSTFYNYYGVADTISLEKFLKNKVTFEEVDHRKAKIIRPKKPGDGTTGIFIDSVMMKGSGINRFQLNGSDLKPQNEKLLLEAIRTIKFKP